MGIKTIHGAEVVWVDDEEIGEGLYIVMRGSNDATKVAGPENVSKISDGIREQIESL